MRILITGGTGLLGKALIETNCDLHPIWTIYLGSYHMIDDDTVRYFNLNICNENIMGDIFKLAQPEVVIHTAGNANVDYSELNYKESWDFNVKGTQIVIDYCKKHNSKIIFTSTNAVFNGENAPYSEEDMPSPINNYGRLKLEAEGLVKSSGLKYLIVRPILMYGWNNENERLNPVTWLIQKLKNKEKVNMVNDVYENPLFNSSCAEAIWLLIRLKKEGVYHIAGKDIMNRYEFARVIAEVFSLDKGLINPVGSDFFEGIAPRPRNTSYNTSRIERETNMRPIGIKEGLEMMKSMKK